MCFKGLWRWLRPLVTRPPIPGFLRGCSKPTSDGTSLPQLAFRRRVRLPWISWNDSRLPFCPWILNELTVRGSCLSRS